jgi:hypothetical protein
LKLFLTKGQFMNSSRRNFVSSTTATVAIAAATSAVVSTPAVAKTLRKVSKKVQSISAMTFAPDGRLIVADWRTSALHSLTLPTLATAKETSFNVLDLSERLAKAYQMDALSVRVTASALDVKSQVTFLALALGRQANAPAGLAMVDAQGKMTILELDNVWAATQPLSGAPGESNLWSKQTTRSLLVTDIKAMGNELIVAGLSNSSFDSTLRRVPYPFTGAGSASAVSMYHAVHNQIETRAPVRAFNIVDVAGQPTLLAAYTCTPLVTVPMADLIDGAKVRGKTIAELGFGNSPIDVLSFSIEYQGQKSDWVLIANSAKAADLISLPDIVKAAQSEGLSKPVKAPFDQFAGVRTIPVPIANLQRVMDQGPQFLNVLRRDVQSGQLQLVSVRKGAFFRLSDHVNEYDFANYAYPADDKFQQDYIRPFHGMMKRDEGHAALVK